MCVRAGGGVYAVEHHNLRELCGEGEGGRKGGVVRIGEEEGEVERRGEGEGGGWCDEEPGEGGGSKLRGRGGEHDNR